MRANGLELRLLAYVQPLRAVLRAGKFIGHFSAENLRSSRSLLTAERYMALNEHVGVEGDLAWERREWSLAAEGPTFRFDTPDGGDVTLAGGYLQPAWFVKGDASNGLQLNAVAHRVNGPAPAQDSASARWVPLLLAQLQFKL